jgi:hypothetical protein
MPTVLKNCFDTSILRCDDVRYDSINEQIYVGYGEGGIAVIDARSHKQTGDIKLTGHPEGFN